ncbi:M23 family metallopeptidase [Kordia algicida OT-1]|uniref:Membrane metalloendopeptidase n=1 Tax=Kordia algicida OT-1 TaxID=391587 RepID=A9CTZ3_9FLAO|nr:M23 family metallopeptidase [Kordia algicida]EDP94161.1 membrane metalloendopeptidase [Kordia algicida OT-1]
MKKLFIILCLCFLGCQETTKRQSISESIYKKTNATQNAFVFFDSLFVKNPKYLAKGFDFPVGKPNAKGYYNAQKFTVNNHLGDDWNGTGGGNTDLGDPVYAIGNGYVAFADDVGGGWGNVIRIIHQYNGTYYESLYAHCEKISVKKGSFVTKGMQIGTIGNADGAYYAHLHLEIRDNIFMKLGGGYSENTEGFLNPTTFIKSNR